MRIRVGTRRSRLALRQAEIVAEMLQALYPEVDTCIIAVTTSGDDPARNPEGGRKDLFVKELQQALLEGRVDIAVHSLKDVPLHLPKETVLAAFCHREDPADVFVSYDFQNLEGLPPGGKVGTSSPRRAFQLSLYRHDLEVVPLRGNVDTRIMKVRQGVCDGIVLAAAGLNRLGIKGFFRERLPFRPFLPSPGQGTLTVEARKDDRALLRLIARLDRPGLRAEAEAERSFCLTVGADCDTRTGALATCREDRLHLRGFHWFEEIDAAMWGEIHGPAAEAAELGKRLALMLIKGEGDVMEVGAGV